MRTKDQPTLLRRVVTFNQVAFNAVLLIVGGSLVWSGDRRGGFLILLIIGAFAPFSFSRLGLYRYLERHLPAAFVGPLAASGLLFDWIMTAQILGARQTEDSAWVHAMGVTWIGPVWFSAHILLLLGYAAIGLVQFGRALLRRLPVKRWLTDGKLGTRLSPSSTLDPVMGRRELVQKAGLVAVAVPFGVSVSSIPLSYDFRVETREFILPNWPAALDGLRVVHLSDIHVGGAMDRDRLLRVAELANGCEPDLVVHTGDFLTHRPGEFDKPLYEALAAIRAPHGQWGCFGNHDYENPDRFERRVHESGVTILRNRLATIPIDGHILEVGGLEFAFNRLNRAPIYAESMQSWGARTGSARILLNHDPTGFASLPAGCADLVLSGHTHGGHIGVQLSPSTAITLVGLIGIPDQGLFGRDDMRMYVTRCVGFYGYPMRIGIPPEVALLILRSPQVVGAPATEARAA